MAEGTDVTSLAPVITLAPGANITPESGVAQDFSQQVAYTVTAEDGATVTYLVLAYAYEPMRGQEAISVFVSPDSGVGGSTNPSGATMYDPTIKFVCYAYPSTGYVLEGWYVNSVKKGSSQMFNDFIPSGYNLLAVFQPTSMYSVTVQSEDTNRGTVSGGAPSVPSGSGVSIYATPKSGYTFEGWYDGVGTKVALVANTTYYPTSSCVLTAKFNMSASISGTAAFCINGSATFGASAVGSFSWSKSSNLGLSGSGGSVTVTGNSNGAGWVSVIDNFNNKEVAKYTVWVGLPTLGNLYCEGYYSYYGGYNSDWTVSVYGNPIDAEWIVTGINNNGATIQGYIDNYLVSGSLFFANIFFPEPGTYTISVRALNSCGASSFVYYYNFKLN